MASPVRAQVTILEETFDGPGAPIGWSLPDGWSVETSSPSSGSGGSNLKHPGNRDTAAQMPPINLSAATSGTLTYLARRTGSYGPDNLSVEASVDGGATFPVTLLAAGSAVPSADSEWEIITVDLPAEVLGASDVIIRFQGSGFYSSGANARFDDVTITADVPIHISPTWLTLAAPTGGTDTKSITATNTTSDGISVAAPSVTGSAFSIDPSGPIDLAAGASQAYDITFAASEQGTIHGSVRLSFGSGSVEVALTGTGSGGIVGFSTSSTSAPGDAAGLAIPMQLVFSAASGLQGLQFRVEWTGADLGIDGVERGAAIANESDWSLSHEEGTGYVDIVLLGEGAESLDSGTHDPLVTLVVDASAVGSASGASLAVTNVIGALGDPEGSDAQIGASSDLHVISFEPQTAYFEPSATTFDFRDIKAGETGTSTLNVSNQGGNSDLEIETIDVSNPLFRIDPTSAVIPPDGEENFTVTFAPTAESFGRQQGEITFHHNGEGGLDVISLTGKGLGGRGDAEGDGAVDALDIVHAIDFVLNRLTPDALQKAAADLYPFPDGDSQLDVRDLTVLSQAIVRGRWPDDVDLPIEEPASGKSESSGIFLTVDPLLIEFEHDIPIRAFQIVLPAEEGARVDVDTSSDVPASIIFGVRTNVAEGVPGSTSELRVLVYRLDGELISPGVVHLATHGVIGKPRYVTVIGEGRERLRVDASVWTSTEDAPRTSPVTEKPYPNPFSSAAGALNIPLGANAGRVIIYDLLGRAVQQLSGDGGGAGGSVKWSGLDAAGREVGPGLYFVRIEGMRGARTHAVQVVR